MDDWQDAAFNHRRIPHGRSKKGGKAAGRKGAGTFDPKQALGSYDLRGSVIQDASAEADDKTTIIEIHELTETPGGFIGSLVIGSRMKAAVILAGSRKLLSTIIEDLESAEDDETSDMEADDPQGESDQGSSDAETEIEGRDRKANELVNAFEKNSFRSPKFWLRWQGDITAKEGEGVRERNQGYVVFAGNDCKDFQGTLSCKALGWKDVSMHGRKVTARARSAPFDWGDFAMGDSVSDEEVDPSTQDDG